MAYKAKLGQFVDLKTAGFNNKNIVKHLNVCRKMV